MRASGQGQPGGDFDGAFTDDYKYADESGDVDKCNCMMWNGSYQYYVNTLIRGFSLAIREHRMTRLISRGRQRHQN